MSITTSLLTEAMARVEGQKTTVLLLAQGLRKAMQEMHGGEWRMQIDHEVGLVVIAERCGDRRIEKPKRGEAA